MDFHEPVLQKEVIEYLQPAPGKTYIDCTLGDGGHTIALLKLGAKVLGIDYDSDSLETAPKRIKSEGLEDNFIGVRGNFRNLYEIAAQKGFTQVDGVLYDLGYSSTQLFDNKKGLSFIEDSPLDMRLDEDLGVSAADLVNTLPEKALASLFWEYGEERLAKRFAKAIIKNRKLKKIETTKQLSDLIVSVSPSGYDGGRLHSATRVFQALRIVVNDEIENLKISLPQAARILKLPAGRIVVIAFHSLEDKVVKNFGPHARPSESLGIVVPLIKKPITPTTEEVRKNRRARSAKMRVFEIQNGI